jgi:hypothetical protein
MLHYNLRPIHYPDKPFVKKEDWKVSFPAFQAGDALYQGSQEKSQFSKKSAKILDSFFSI